MELSQFASEKDVEHLGTETVKDISFAKFQENSEIFYLFQSNPNTIHTPVLDEVGIKGKRLTFTKEASPLIMENYITYSVSDAGDDVRVLRHSFYVKELLASRSRPSDVEPSSNYSYDGEVDFSGFYVFSMVGIATGL